VSQPRARAQHVLAVIQQQQAALTAQELAQLGHGAGAGAFLQAHGSGDCQGHVVRVAEAGQIYEPNAAVEPTGNPLGQLHGQACLAAATRSRQGQQAVRREDAGQIGEVLLPAYKGRQLEWQRCRHLPVCWKLCT